MKSKSDHTDSQKLLGIIGGLGPLASAEFVNTFYQLNAGGIEQSIPSCVLYSDPSFPDRTKAILGGDCRRLVDRLSEVLERLLDLGVTKTVICCITIHHVLPRLPSRLTAHIIPLIDLIVDDVSRSCGRHLLLCTCGTRQAGIFQQHARWPSISRQVVLPDDADQHAIHDIIYQAKQNRIDEPVGRFLDLLREKYGADRFIAGCTEIHLIAKKLNVGDWNGHSDQFADPLLMLARDFDRYVTV